MALERGAPGRFVPTLTEVVESTPDESRGAASISSEEELVQRVWRSLQQDGDARLHTLLRGQIEELLPQLAQQLLPEMEAMVRQRVAQELARQKVGVADLGPRDISAD